MLKFAVFAANLLMMGSSAQAMIQGLYGTRCLAIGDGLSACKDIAFTDEGLKQVQTVFLDEHCEEPAYDFTFEGPFLLDETRGLLDYSFESVRLMPLTERVAESFNARSLCGITHWIVDQPIDVAGLDCNGARIPTVESFVYDRIKVHQKSHENGILMGSASGNHDGSTPEQRPVALDETLYHAR